MTLLTTKLISLSELIAQASRNGVDFDGSNPKEHIFYLSKIGLLPKAVKKTNAFGKLEAHYQPNVVDLFVRIYNLKKSGLAYSQIGKFSNLNINHALPETHADSGQRLESYTTTLFPGEQHPGGSAGLPNQTVVYLIIGLILGYLVSANNSLKSNATNLAKTVEPQTVVTASQANPPSQVLFRLLTTSSSNNNNDLYLITLPKSNFSKLEKIQFTDLSGSAGQQIAN